MPTRAISNEPSGGAPNVLVSTGTLIGNSSTTFATPGNVNVDVQSPATKDTVSQ